MANPMLTAQKKASSSRKRRTRQEIDMLKSKGKIDGWFTKVHVGRPKKSGSLPPDDGNKTTNCRSSSSTMKKTNDGGKRSATTADTASAHSSSPKKKCCRRRTNWNTEWNFAVLRERVLRSEDMVSGAELTPEQEAMVVDIAPSTLQDHTAKDGFNSYNKNFLGELLDYFNDDKPKNFHKLSKEEVVQHVMKLFDPSAVDSA